MAWAPGDSVALREIYEGRIWAARPVTVVRDDSIRAFWIPEGTVLKLPFSQDGEQLRMQPDEWTLRDLPFEGSSVLRLATPGAAHSVLLFWQDNRFAGWYVNLEEPLHRSKLGFDYLDHKLDLIFWPDGSWEWKDEDELAQAVERGILSSGDAAAIRAEGERVLATFPNGEFFSHEWRQWTPDPSWGIPQLPLGWDVM